MDYRNILAFAAVIFASGYFFRSFQPVYAYPQGPNVSIGSNPIENFYGNVSQTGSITFQDNFIVTGFMSDNYGCNPSIVGNSKIYNATGIQTNVFYHRNVDPGNSLFTSGRAMLKIPAGSTLSLGNCNNYYIQGYYTH